MRERLPLDGTWRFVRDPGRTVSGTDLPEGEPVTVPGCWEAQVDDPFGLVTAWYWRSLVIPESWPQSGQTVAIFGAVMYACDVWLDGRPLASHEGGYTSFEVPLTGVRPGVRTQLAVRVTNPMNAMTHYPALSDERLDAADAAGHGYSIREVPHGKQTWYASQSGLWRSVVLEHRPRSHLGRPRPLADLASGIVRLRGLEPASEAGEHDELAVFGPDGREVVRRTLAGHTERDEAAIEIPAPVPWDIGAPNLYRLVTQRFVDRDPVDEVTVRFGFREVRYEGGRIILNGRPILLRGALDQDLYDGTMSTPPSRAVLDDQLRVAREMGLNLLRCHIKVPDQAYLDAADEAGMLLWCELPNWLRMSPSSARRGEMLLQEMVEQIGHHPSVLAWTIINEDWGTDLRHSARDRRWLRRLASRLRAMDPTRLVVDNSPCPAAGGPNFHVDTDLADFHLYAAMPDAAARWRAQMDELATGPAWLWSPHGDAVRRGDEPIILSEFGTWSLPDPERLEASWWTVTGDGPARPEGLEDRFAEQRLNRVWPDVRSMCAGTQRLHVEALRYQVGEIRRHQGMAGLVVTEFTDAHWEANGLLDLARGVKADHERLKEIFGASILIIDPERQDLWGGDSVRANVILSSEASGTGGRLRWAFGTVSRSMAIGPWQAASATPLATIELAAPAVDDPVDLDLQVWLDDRDGRELAHASVTCAVQPASLRASSHPLRIAVHDEMGLWEIPDRLIALGHRVAPADDCDVQVTTHLGPAHVSATEAGQHVLLLARSEDAIDPTIRLARPARIVARWPDPGRAGADFTWTGDWISAFSWLTREFAADQPWRAPLDFTYREVLPDHVIAGYEPTSHAAEVPAGVFVGWVHAPAAIVWSFAQGRGRLTITTFRLAPEAGPVASLLFEALIRLASRPPD